VAKAPKLSLEQLGMFPDFKIVDEISASLAGRYGIPPFTVFDARQGYWQKRKRQWLTLGIQSELGRGENVLNLSAACDDYRDGVGNYGKTFKSQASLDVIQHGKGTREGYAVPGGNQTEASVWLKRSRKANATPGGGLMPAASQPKGEAGKAGAKTVRGDGKGRRLTWVAGDRGDDELDPTSKKILMSGAKKAVSMPAINGVMDRDDDAGGVESRTGTSIFDPVLCECLYRWFSPVGGKVLDPFAGGSVRGIVATILGREYYGVDLRAEQIEANKAQGTGIVPHNQPNWYAGDSLNIREIVPSQEYDFIFSCPPYADLERYSDDPRDISTMDYPEFMEVYRQIIKTSAGMLADNRFAAWVVGDVRNKQGYYYGFVRDTIDAVRDAGMELYNDGVLITSVGSLPVRVSAQFPRGRKLGKAHQNVLIFYRGDPKLIGAMDERDIPDVVALDPGDKNTKPDAYRMPDQVDLGDLPL
jgi:hypothetical protein